MRPEAARADRNASIRKAARGWRKAEAIDDATLAAVEQAVPDDRVRVGPVFRGLLFLFTLLTANAGFGLLWMLLGEPDAGFLVLAAVFGIAMTVLTEWQTGKLRRAQGGTEAATSLMALGSLLAALAWLLFESFGLSIRPGLPVLLLAAALLAALASWRWGFPLYAALAAAALLWALAFVPGGRLLWIVLPLAAAPLLLRGADSARLPPSHRSACLAALLVGLAGLYLAVHLGSFDVGLVEKIADLSRLLHFETASPVLRGLSLAGTALVPLFLLAWGIRSRRRSLLLLGTATAVASVATWRWYVPLAPAWVILTAAGAATVVLALGLRRWLDSGPDKERGGFTAEPLFEDLAAQRALEIGAAMVSFSPAAAPAHADDRFQGGGGEFGGGGSSSSF